MKETKEIKEEKVKSPHRFRALDAVIILLVLMAVIGIYFRYNILDLLTKNRDLREYTVTFSIEDIRYSTPNYINVGDQVYFSDSGEALGVLLAGSEDMENMALSGVKPASKFFLSADGTKMEEIFYPNSESRVDAMGRMLCSGTYTDNGGFLVNGSRYIAAGQTISIYTEMVTVAITIQEIVLAEG